MNMSIYQAGRPKKYNPTTGAGNKPPKLPGEYRICSADGTINYIGETNNLNRRMNEHLRSGKLPTGKLGGTIEWQPADINSTSVSRRSHERIKIAKHLPRGNKSRGGEGRIAF